MRLSPEFIERVRKVAAKNPELTYVALGERFRLSHGTINRILGAKPKTERKPARPQPRCVAECSCGWSFTGPRDRVLYQRREHYDAHPDGTPKARTTISRAP